MGAYHKHKFSQSLRGKREFRTKWTLETSKRRKGAKRPGESPLELAEGLAVLADQWQLAEMLPN